MQSHISTAYSRFGLYRAIKPHSANPNTRVPGSPRVTIPHSLPMLRSKYSPTDPREDSSSSVSVNSLYSTLAHALLAKVLMDALQASASAAENVARVHPEDRQTATFSKQIFSRSKLVALLACQIMPPASERTS